MAHTYKPRAVRLYEDNLLPYSLYYDNTYVVLPFLLMSWFGVDQVKSNSCIRTAWIFSILGTKSEPPCTSRMPESSSTLSPRGSWSFEVSAIRHRGLGLEQEKEREFYESVGKRAEGLPDSKQLAPPMDTWNEQKRYECVADVLGIRDWGRRRGGGSGNLTHTVKHNAVVVSVRFSLRPCIRGGSANVYIATSDKSIHGGPRVYDGKYWHRPHVLLRGRYVQWRANTGRSTGLGRNTSRMCMPKVK
ncbi:unnamed protein product [Spodoptera exigua]|nr:unnamed protein product [Spodoptera exigua]